MIDKLKSLESRYETIIKRLSEPDVAKDNRKLQELMKEKSDLDEIVSEYRKIKEVHEELTGAKEMAKSEEDAEMKAMAESEVAELEEKLDALYTNVKFLLIPKDKNEGKNIIIEIRAGTGGDESAIFAGDLFRMYTRFCDRKGFKIEILESNETGLGGYKEVIFSVNGKEAYKLLKYESGTHRVQRIPVTESGGRIHTSAATVAVMPEAEDAEVDIKEEDLRIDVFRAGGPGGQSVNTTDSAVRITHVPTNTVVQCQDEKSQHKNKAKALKVLRARIYEKQEKERKQAEAATRKSQIGTGDRSERIRTYNFPQSRVTDHRINLTLYKLDMILGGEIEELVDALIANEKEELLQEFSSKSD